MKTNPQTPPNWAPGAIQTIYGWANPKTGEILVAKRGLNNPVAGFVRGRPYVAPEPQQEVILDIKAPEPQQEVILDIETPDILVPSTFVDIVVEPQPPIKEAPQQRRRGRSAKTKD
jgi:hypothetical protein